EFSAKSPVPIQLAESFIMCHCSTAVDGWHVLKGRGFQLIQNRLRLLSAFSAWLVLLATTSHAAPADAMDWPNWRGPQQNRASTEKGLIEKWNPEGGEGSNLLWKKKEFAGRSTPIVFRGKLYTIVHDHPETPIEGEKVVCADAVTGNVVWEHPMNVYLSDVPADHPGRSSCVPDP